MNPSHEPPVEHAGAFPLSPAMRQSPESPPPAGEQAATFSQALAQFVASHRVVDLSPVEVEQFDCALFFDMRNEFRRCEAIRQWP